MLAATTATHRYATINFTSSAIQSQFLVTVVGKKQVLPIFLILLVRCISPILPDCLLTGLALACSFIRGGHLALSCHGYIRFHS